MVEVLLESTVQPGPSLSSCESEGLDVMVDEGVEVMSGRREKVRD